MVAAMLLSACDWSMLGYGPGRTRFNPGDSEISTENVSNLVHRFTASPVGEALTEPAVAGGVLYVADALTLSAFSATGSENCTGNPASCSPLWTAPLAGDGSYLGTTPTIANGRVYAPNGEVFDAAGITNCSGSPKTCAPLWAYAPVMATAPVVVDGVAYATKRAFDPGPLYAFDAAGVTNCSGTPKTCSPLWTASTDFGTSGQPPAVANGVVYVSAGTVLMAFDAAGVTNCTGTPKTCSPLWTTPSQQWGLGAPVVDKQTVYVPSIDLLAFDATGTRNCSGSPKVCTPLWRAGGGGVSAPAIANGVVYVSTVPAETRPQLLAFDASGSVNCSAGAVGMPKSCAPLWRSPGGGSVWFGITGMSAPAVADGVVYVSTNVCCTAEPIQIERLISGFDAAGTQNCSGVPKTCTPLWSATHPTGVTSLAIANGILYGMGNAVYAFGLP